MTNILESNLAPLRTNLHAFCKCR